MFRWFKRHRIRRVRTRNLPMRDIQDLLYDAAFRPRKNIPKDE